MTPIRISNENYACGSLRNYTNYCNPALEKEFDAQSMETDVARRKAIVWDIERKLADDVVRPIIYHNVAGACWHSYVKNVTIMVNSIYNGWRWRMSGWTGDGIVFPKPSWLGDPTGQQYLRQLIDVAAA